MADGSLAGIVSLKGKVSEEEWQWLVGKEAAMVLFECESVCA